VSKAVVTAGGRIDGEFAAEAGTVVKALVRVRGETMLDAVLGALRGAGVGRIAVIGGAEVRAACARTVDRFVEEGESGAENVRRALGAWSDDDGEPLLYATSDMPYVTAQAVADFVVRVPTESVAVALAEHLDFATRFPDAPSSFGITLAGERVVNGGLFSVPAGSCARVARIATAFFDARKQPWKMATLVSPIAIVRFVFGRLSVERLEAAAQKTLGTAAAAVRNCAPELAYDADTIDDYRYAIAHA
jgi:GTP:adenosylcobinamide-phosphate guanylyltransferase